MRGWGAQHVDDDSVETGSLDLDDVFVVAIRQDRDLAKHSLQALVLAELSGAACLDLEYLDSHLPIEFQVQC